MTVTDWRELFEQGLTAGDGAGGLAKKTTYDWDDETGDYRVLPAFEDGMHSDYLDRELGRIGYAQAQYLRAIAVAAGQSATEMHDVAEWLRVQAVEAAATRRAVTALADVLTAELPSLSASAARGAAMQTEMARVLLASTTMHLGERIAELENDVARSRAAMDDAALPGWLRWLVRVFRARRKTVAP